MSGVIPGTLAQATFMAAVNPEIRPVESRPNDEGAAMADVNWRVGVSFLRTPFAEIPTRIEAIEAWGWKIEGRGDPWVISFSKAIPEETRDPEAELREVMGDDWMRADEIRRLLGIDARS